MVLKEETRGNHEKILQYLAADRYISGEEIAKSLGLTRTSVWKAIRGLREKGFTVEAHPKKGYILKGYPDKLYPFVIKMRLNSKLFGRKIVFLQDIDSTNRLAKKLAMEGEEEGTIVITEYQREGKGRLDRQWIMPQGKGLLFSIIFRPKLFPNEAFRLTMITSVAIAKAIKQELGLDSWIKWPNDIYIKDKKVGGILTEFSAEQDQIRYVIVGAGLNCNFDPADYPQLKETATSLMLEGGSSIDRVSLFRAILEGIEERYFKLYEKEGKEELRKEWLSLSGIKNRNVKVLLGDETVEGTVEGIDEDGALILACLDGEKKIYFGDLVLSLKTEDYLNR